MATQVKICGITTLEDALDAVELGADYLGFNFFPGSPRCLDPVFCKHFLQEIPYNVARVGVFVNADPQFVIDVATELDLDLLQFHGDEVPDYVRQFARPKMKALRPSSEDELKILTEYGCDHVLIDAPSKTAYGGTGTLSVWDCARIAGRVLPVFLAGGLKPDNIELAVHAVKPFAVDVASGVEVSPGRKDYRKMEEFIRRAKGLA